jgi:hypothetical protein
MREKRSHYGTLRQELRQPGAELVQPAASQDLHRRRPLRGPVIVLALRAPSFGQLLCPVRKCAATLRSLRSLRVAVRFAASSPRPPAAPFLSATRRPPAAYLFDFASAALRHNNQGRPRVAARRPPSSAFPRAALPGAWRKGGGKPAVC